MRKRNLLPVRTKRIYDPVAEDDGCRVLVERLWPRGLSKEKARVDVWLKDIAPSTALRKWFGHDPAKWEEFQRRYEAELAERGEAVEQLLELTRQGPVTLVYAASDTEHNSAVVLKRFLEKRLKSRRGRPDR
ncbi:MAG: DUF488 domain-containing protein [Planctomycetota bacterium]|nr:MAG: DUF488 domain-containing protein [Planctomycetota bacterium]